MGIWKIWGRQVPIILWKKQFRTCWVNGTNSTTSARQKLVKTWSTGKDPPVWPKSGPEPEVSHSATLTNCALCSPKLGSAPPSMSTPAFLSPVALIQQGANSEQLDDPHKNSSTELQFFHCMEIIWDFKKGWLLYSVNISNKGRHPLS